MNPDLRRQLLIVAAFVLTIALNGAANALPLNGQSTAEISDRWEVLITPAGYVFAIWGLIYLGQLAFTVDQARPSRRTDPRFRALGLLPALAGLLNAVWIIAWHWEVYPATLAIMVGLLLTLIAIHLRIAGRDDLAGPRWGLTVRWPFSVYLGWISVATIVNVAVVLSWLGLGSVFTPAEVWAAVVLAVGLAIAVTFVLRERDPAYGLVFVWAYLGIAAKEADVVPVATMAIAGAVVVAGLVVFTVLRPRGPAAGVGAGALGATRA